MKFTVQVYPSEFCLFQSFETRLKNYGQVTSLNSILDITLYPLCKQTAAKI